MGWSDGGRTAVASYCVCIRVCIHKYTYVFTNVFICYMSVCVSRSSSKGLSAADTQTTQTAQQQETAQTTQRINEWRHNSASDFESLDPLSRNNSATSDLARLDII